MDPNATLAELRSLCLRETAAGDGSYAADIVEHFEALDEWLSKGGYLPAAWMEFRGKPVR